MFTLTPIKELKPGTLTVNVTGLNICNRLANVLEWKCNKTPVNRRID